MQTCWHYKIPVQIYLQESFCCISNSSLASNHNTSFCFEHGQTDWLNLLAVIKLQLRSLFPAVDSVTKSSYLLSQLRKRSRFSSAKLQTAAPNDLQFWMGILSITVSKALIARSAWILCLRKHRALPEQTNKHKPLRGTSKEKSIMYLLVSECAAVPLSMQMPCVWPLRCTCCLNFLGCATLDILDFRKMNTTQMKRIYNFWFK